MSNVQNEDLSEQDQELFDETNSPASPEPPKAYIPTHGAFLKRSSSSSDSGEFYAQQALQARKTIKFGCYENINSQKIKDAPATGTQAIQ